MAYHIKANLAELGSGSTIEVNGEQVLGLSAVTIISRAGHPTVVDLHMPLVAAASDGCSSPSDGAHRQKTTTNHQVPSGRCN